ncbi:hypothetical protein GUJ93_ZPchr0007g5181 [Zizania palustris]|nr:hypothetical protein GUJ93_ZPchr0007g5181 [Zizania palustris]KAG8079710.1 hypothetical protein GUJ93_ZPchr0007g5181 [Zizania palustris]
MATCVERIMLHWRFKDGDPEKIYPRSSFCINCKGDVCRGDAVLFKQKVYEKSQKKHSKCIGKRIVAGKVIKESYGKDKQQHTFTVQVYWSKGVGKLPPLSLLLVKGRNLYRMITFRQHWPNEVDRLKALEEKHNRGNAARLVRALNKPIAAGNNKKLMQNKKHQSQPGRPDGGASIKEGKKRVMRSSNPDLPTKRSRKEEHQVPSGKKCTGGQRAKTNHAPDVRLDKNVCTSSSTSLCKGNMQKYHATLQKNCHMEPLNNGPYNTEVRMNKTKADSQQNHAQFQERCASSGSSMQASHGYFVGIQQPPLEIMRPPRPLPLREVGNTGQAHMDGRSMACPRPRMGPQHPNAASVGWHAPAYSRGTAPSQPRVPFPSFNVPQAMHHPRPGGACVMPQFRYSGGSNGSR